MHSWRTMRDLLEAVGKPGVVGYQADMAHSMLYTLGYNAEADRILPEGYDWHDKAALDAAYRQVADALRPWTLDFHVAQNDGTVFGSGDHEKTGRHCRVDDPNGRLDIVKHAGYWLRDENGALTKTMRHICWDACMLPNAVMEDQQTWNAVLGAMVKVRDAHGWTDEWSRRNRVASGLRSRALAKPIRTEADHGTALSGGRASLGRRARHAGRRPARRARNADRGVRGATSSDGTARIPSTRSASAWRRKA